MQVVAVYSESGGVTKTTTAVSLAMASVIAGKRTLLVDLDPRAAASKWIGVEPKEKGWHVGAILSDDDASEWVHQVVIDSPWDERLKIIPSSRTVSNREADQQEAYAELRLRRALMSMEDFDLVILDCPNRQGGPLTLAALNAADTVIYAATATAAGIDGVEGARVSVAKFKKHRAEIGAPDNLQEAGIILGDITDTISPRAERAVIDDLDATGILLRPFVPRRTVVREVQITNEWYGSFRKGAPVIDAYKLLAEKVIR